MPAPLSPLRAPAFLKRLRHPRDLKREPLLRSFRAAEWVAWFQAAGVEPPLVNGMIFDSSPAMTEAAAQGHGVALLPVGLFARELCGGRLVRPFALEVHAGSYWLTPLGRAASRRWCRPSPSGCTGRLWLLVYRTRGAWGAEFLPPPFLAIAERTGSGPVPRAALLNSEPGSMPPWGHVL